MTQPCVTFNDLTLGYNSHPAVHHLDGAVRRGSLTAIVGANGSGKSTLMKAMAGILRPMSGTCTVAPGIRTAYLPQQSELDRTFPVRVIDLVSLGLWPRRGLLGRHSAADRTCVSEAIASVGLSGFEQRPLDTLSGGQLQRALFARVVVQDADLILLDEPFNAVDTRTVIDLIALLKTWQAEGRTVMVVMHDFDLVRRVFPETILLARRPIAWGRTQVALSAENLARAHGFHEAWDETAPWCAAEEHVHEGDGGHAHPHGDGHDHSRHDHAGKAVHATPRLHETAGTGA